MLRVVLKRAQGYLAHKKQRPPRTLQMPRALWWSWGGGAVSCERGTPLMRNPVLPRKLKSAQGFKSWEDTWFWDLYSPIRLAQRTCPPQSNNYLQRDHGRSRTDVVDHTPPPHPTSLHPTSPHPTPPHPTQPHPTPPQPSPAQPQAAHSPEGSLVCTEVPRS